MCIYSRGPKDIIFLFPFFFLRENRFFASIPNSIAVAAGLLRKYDQDRVGVRTREPAAYGGVVSLVVCRTVAVDSLEGRV